MLWRRGGRYSHWIAYFNDNGENTSDCISNDWITIYFHNDGEVSVGSSFNPNCLHMPWVPCSLKLTLTSGVVVITLIITTMIQAVVALEI